ncbi:hypothetical protein CBL_07913 [Carabus blaptoides fortunei]
MSVACMMHACNTKDEDYALHITYEGFMLGICGGNHRDKCQRIFVNVRCKFISESFRSPETIIHEIRWRGCARLIYTKLSPGKLVSPPVVDTEQYKAILRSGCYILRITSAKDGDTASRRNIIVL